MHCECYPGGITWVGMESLLTPRYDIKFYSQEMICQLHSLLEGSLPPQAYYTAFRARDTDEQRLLKALLKNYEKAVRPVLNASSPVELKIGLTLNQIDVVSIIHRLGQW